LSTHLSANGIKVNGIQDPKYYAGIIEREYSVSPDFYESKVSIAYINLKSGNTTEGIKTITEVI
jgi:hypothetical protein